MVLFFSSSSIENLLQFDIKFENISVTLGEKQILQNISGAVKRRNLLGILGPSGKTDA